MRTLVCLAALLLLATPASGLVVVAESTAEEAYRVRAADPRTLATHGRSVGVRGCSGAAADVSPSGRRVAVLDCPGGGWALRFLDRRRWAFSGAEVPLPSRPLAVLWATDRRVLVLTDNGALQASVFVIDPRRGRVIARRELDHTPKEARRVGRHWAVIDSDYRFFSVPDADRDDSVLRLFDAGGGERTIPLGTRLLDTDTHSLSAAGGRLYVALGDRVLVVDPETGRRRSLPVAGAGVLDLLAVSATRIAGAGHPTAAGNEVRVLDRRSGREVLRRPARFGSVGFGTGWASPLRDGLVAYAASGRRLWAALRGQDVLVDYTVQRIRRYLYVSSHDREDPGLRVIGARSGRTVHRTTDPLPPSPLDWASDGLLTSNYVGDGGDEADE